METRLSRPDCSDSLAARAERVDCAVTGAAKALLFEGEASIFSGMAVLAVGGYGRREMFPHSDVDLLILCESGRFADDHKAKIAAFLQQLWDSGLRVSQSVRTPDECSGLHNGNAELSISLLDRRFLAGDAALFATLEEQMPRFLRVERTALIRNLIHLTRGRHAKYAGSFYHLEPNVKETPGGLRDFQVIRWLEKMRAPVTSETPPELAQAFEFFCGIRCWLHERSQRDQNVFTFEAQDALAEHWGGCPPEQIMREYYLHSRTIYRAATREIESLEAQTSNLYAQFRDWRSRLGNADIAVRRERCHLREPQLLEADPGLTMRIFEFVARHGIPPSLETSRRLSTHLERIERHFAAQPPRWSDLNTMFTSPHASAALRSMHETGVLGAFFPELKGIECQVIRDFYHRYTVDEHTIVAIESLLKPPDPFLTLLSEVDKPGALVFATLFHDAGKGDASAGHVESSVALAEAAMDRISFPQPERATVIFLIRNHLYLSAIMRSRDTFAPETISEVAARVDTVERLKALTLLTYADISAVNPSAMTPWRSAHLWQLYLAAYNALTRELESGRIEDSTSAPQERSTFLAGFPKRYLRTNTEAEIAAHMHLAERGRTSGAAVDVRKLDSAWQLTVAAIDRPGLFAGAAGTLSCFGLNILRAEAFSNRQGLALDTFTFSDPLRNLELNPSEIDRLRFVSERVLSGRADVKQLLKSRPKAPLPSRKANIPATVTFDSEASRKSTLVEIVAADRPGLLYDLASIFSEHGCNIEVVLIDTEAHKAIDVFYVTADGKKLTPDMLSGLTDALTRAAS